MEGRCIFCGEFKELTHHHILARSYGGASNPDNLIPNICRDCHDSLEFNLNEARAKAGAGGSLDSPYFNIGTTSTTLLTGSALLDEKGLAFVDPGSPILGMRIHNKITGERYLEATTSSGNVILISGSPTKSWVIYSFAKKIN